MVHGILVVITVGKLDRAPVSGIPKALQSWDLFQHSLIAFVKI